MPLRLSCTLREFVFFFNMIPPQESKNHLKKSGTLQPIRAASGPSSHCISPPSPFENGLLWILKSQRWCGRCQEIRETNKEISLIYFLFCQKIFIPTPRNKKQNIIFFLIFGKAGFLVLSYIYFWLVVVPILTLKAPDGCDTTKAPMAPDFSSKDDAGVSEVISITSFLPWDFSPNEIRVAAQEKA